LARAPRAISTGTTPHRGKQQSEANMGEVVRFISKAERERIRLIQEARAHYDSVFPPSSSTEQQRGQDQDHS
jgi:hypothetical protein